MPKKGGSVGLFKKRDVKVNIFLDGIFLCLIAKLRFIFHIKRALCFRINLKKILLYLFYFFEGGNVSFKRHVTQEELYFKREAT